MKKIIACLFISVFMIIMMSGCATKGRFSAVDIDLRTPEQIIAYQNEADIVYLADGVVSNGVNTVATKDIVPTTAPWYDIIVKIVEVIKGRVRILSFEWKKQ